MFQFTQVYKERLTNLGTRVDKYNITVYVDRTFSIDDAAKALDYVKEVHPRGKAVLTMSQYCNKQPKPASSCRLPPLALTKKGNNPTSKMDIR